MRAEIDKNSEAIQRLQHIPEKLDEVLAFIKNQKEPEASVASDDVLNLLDDNGFIMNDDDDNSNSRQQFNYEQSIQDLLGKANTGN